jgi:AcrR family transcriptional regulator
MMRSTYRTIHVATRSAVATRTEVTNAESAASATAIARTRGGGARNVEETVRQAALELFVERGFHGTSMRDIAGRAGTNVSHLYYYYPSKASVLRSMMTSIVQDLLTTLNDAAAASGDTPAQRLEALVRATVLFHCRRQAEAFVGRSELRSLDPADRPDVIALYDRVTDVFRVVIDEGVRQGEFRCPYRSEAVHAILTMCNGVSTWYRKGGRLSPEELAARHVALTLQMLGCAAD